MNRHKSTAYASSTQQFRFILRLANACHAKGGAYDVEWRRVGDGSRMAATITAAGDIPTPKALPKPPREKPVAIWKPAIWDAAYSLEAYATEAKKQPGFVIAHSSGLSLVKPSDTGEWGANDDDIRDNWRLTHAASGRGFGLQTTFKRATEALLLAASFAGVDWTQDIATLANNGEARRAQNTVLAKYGKGYTRNAAQDRLEREQREAA